MHFFFAAPPFLKWSQMELYQTKHNNRKLYTENSFSPLLLLVLPFPHETLLTLRCNIHWPYIFVQSYITETPWVFFGDLEIITPPWNTIVFTTRLINTYCQENPTDHPARCLPYNFTFTHTFVSRTSEGKLNICPSLATFKQLPYLCWLVEYENNEDDPSFILTFFCIQLFWPVQFLTTGAAFQ